MHNEISKSNGCEMKQHCFLLLVLFVLAAAAEARLGGWSPLKDLKNPRVVELGEYAVSEHNKRSGAGLKLEEVVKGEVLLAAGFNFRLVLVAEDGGGRQGKYEAMVREIPWQKLRNLTSFKPLAGIQL